MMAGNPNWWSMHHPQSSHQLSVSSSFVYGGGGSNITSSASADNNPNLNHDFPIRSWSQFILGEGRYGDDDPFQQQKNWEEEQVSILNPYSSLTRQQVPIHADVKQEQLVQSGTCHLYDARRHDETISYAKNTDHDLKANSSYEWLPPQQTNQLTTSSNSFLDFVQGNKNQNLNQHQHNQDQSSECNSTSNRGGVSKKARFQQSSSQPALKVRKEKLGDRITALHQLVSPFGKTDTASVLSEAICCIRYLQSQIEALSTPYMRNASSATESTSHHQRSEFQSQGDLRSRGLCLVPISCTQNVGNDSNAADYWAPNYH